MRLGREKGSEKPQIPFRPEAADGGNIALIEEGDIIAIDIPNASINVKVTDEELAARYRDGVCLVFRLCVNHYHRYCYPANGEKGENFFIRGKLHTVRPIALEASPVFCENCREYTVIDTDNFGLITQIEVGALLVGKIANLHGARRVERGEEKGMFLYGGSTVVLLLERDKLDIDKEFFAATERGEETPVVMGQALGRRKR